MAAVKEGVGREAAHAAIRDHAVAVALEMREKGRQDNDLLDRLSQDPRLGLPKEKLMAAISDPVEGIVKKYPEAATYVPEPIL